LHKTDFNARCNGGESRVQRAESHFWASKAEFDTIPVHNGEQLAERSGGNAANIVQQEDMAACGYHQKVGRHVVTIFASVRQT
jgi:hypothetical protein